MEERIIMAPHHSFVNRANITLFNTKFLRDGIPCSVSMTHTTISIGCTDITIEAARELIRLYDQNFPVVKEPESVVIQP